MPVGATDQQRHVAPVAEPEGAAGPTARRSSGGCRAHRGPRGGRLSGTAAVQALRPRPPCIATACLPLVRGSAFTALSSSRYLGREALGEVVPRGVGPGRLALARRRPRRASMRDHAPRGGLARRAALLGGRGGLARRGLLGRRRLAPPALRSAACRRLLGRGRAALRAGDFEATRLRRRGLRRRCLGRLVPCGPALPGRTRGSALARRCRLLGRCSAVRRGALPGIGTPGRRLGGRRLACGRVVGAGLDELAGDLVWRASS